MASKIKVDTIENVAGSGNVSLGSGHNLVVPGNITGQGTAAITSNATVGGTLGVTGATTLSSTLSAPLANSNNPSIRLESPTTDVDFTISSYNDANGTYVALGANHYLNSGGNDAVFDTNKKSAGILLDARNHGRIQFVTANTGVASSKMEISKDGYVTKSNQPSWFQYVIGDGTFSSGWKNVPLNPNASTSFPYHIQGGVTTANSNHEVTVPVAGQYQINGAVTLNSASVNTDGTLTISKNNSTMSGGQSSGVYSGALGGTTISMVVTLAANDTVGLDYYFSQSATYRNTSYAGYFSGYLLG